jgi:ribosomal protein L22
MKLDKALTYLENVTKKSMAIPMRRYAGSTGRTAQGEYPRKFSLHVGIGRQQWCQGISD